MTERESGDVSDVRANAIRHVQAALAQCDAINASLAACHLQHGLDILVADCGCVDASICDPPSRLS